MARVNMGLGGFTTNSGLCFPRKFRWLIEIENVTPNLNTPAFTANLLPPKKGARPSVTFRDMEAQHLSETIFFPGKAEWKPINISLWDYKTQADANPVFEWMKAMYRPDGTGGAAGGVAASGAIWTPAVEGPAGTRFKRNATLYMLNGCGDIIEKWVYEHAYPQSINFGELDMGNSEVVTVDLVLRYDRAYRTSVD